MKNSASSVQLPVCSKNSEQERLSAVSRQLNPARGYSLIELIVAIGIFSIVMLAATSAYLTLVSLDRKARATNELVNSLSFGIEGMARSIRTGSTYKCNQTGTNCTSGGTSFAFTDANNRAIVYTVDSGQLNQRIAGVVSPLTDPRISITGLTFYVRGVGTGDGIQPQVTFTVRGSMTTGAGQTSDFTLQSGATQRNLEL